MRHIKLKSVVKQLSVMSVYLLFLSVQLNLKYTFSVAFYSDYSNPVLNNAKTGSNTRSIEKPKGDKPVVQKLRLNKRYVHQDVFFVYSLSDELENTFIIKVDKTFTSTSPVSNAVICSRFLRGPPTSAHFIC
jgi:hypothetical protein